MHEHALHLTAPTRVVLQALLHCGTHGATGLSLSLETQLSPGALHPALAHLEGLGWVESYWQEPGSAATSRARCRSYRITTRGTARAQQALRAAEESRAQWVRRLRPVVGMP